MRHLEKRDVRVLTGMLDIYKKKEESSMKIKNLTIFLSYSINEDWSLDKAGSFMNMKISKKKVYKKLYDKLDDLNLEQLKKVSVLTNEYIQNENKPTMIGNIAAFLCETDISHIAVQDTALYNKQKKL